MTILLRVAGLALLAAIWLRPALALASDGSAPDGSEYIQPGALTAAIAYLLHKINQVAKPLKQLADNGQMRVTTAGYEEQKAEFDKQLQVARDEHAAELRTIAEECAGLRSELERLRAAQELAGELDEMRRQREADAAQYATLQGELAVAVARLETYERLVEFDKRLAGEDDDYEIQPE